MCYNVFLLNKNEFSNEKNKNKRKIKYVDKNDKSEKRWILRSLRVFEWMEGFIWRIHHPAQKEWMKVRGKELG